MINFSYLNHSFYLFFQKFCWEFIIGFFKNLKVFLRIVADF